MAPPGTPVVRRPMGVQGDAFLTDSTLPQLDRGNSVFDIRHRFSVNYVWDVPFCIMGVDFSTRCLQTGNSAESGPIKPVRIGARSARVERKSLSWKPVLAGRMPRVSSMTQQSASMRAVL